ncbi:MAG: ABC transporter substrate-binding protein [Microbacteriaceae bacterium]|nr:ABC transporter substrate-binding protein [Microbacteriaceae bacterium]
MTVSLRRRATQVVAALGAAALLAACTPSAEPSTDPTGAPAGELTPLRIIVAPIQYEPAYLALQEGYFEEAGLAVEILPGADGAANAARVLGGDADMTVSSWTAMVSSTATGVDLKVVMGNGVIGDQSTSGVLVQADSDIKTVADLEGLTVAIQSPGTGTDIPLLVAADEAGIDPASISLANIPYSGMQTALEEGQVDAAFPSSQFYFQMLDAGFREIASPSSKYMAGQPATLWAAGGQWLEANAETAAAFVAAMTRAMEFYTANPDAARAVAAEITGVPIGEVPTNLPIMEPEIQVGPSGDMIGYLERFGVVENPLTLDEILWVDAPRR